MIIGRLGRLSLYALVCLLIVRSAISVAQDTPGPVIDTLVAERLQLGRDAMARGLFFEARDHFGRVLELDWNNPQVYEWWNAAKDSAAIQIDAKIRSGDRLSAKGEYAEALVRYHDALESDSANLVVKRRILATGRKIYARRYLLAGLDYFLQNDYDLARDRLDSALVFDPTNERALSLRERIDGRSAPEVERADLQNDPVSWAIHLAALKDYRAGEYAKAIEQWEKILIKYPGNPDTEANIRQARLRLQADPTEGGRIADGGN